MFDIYENSNNETLHTVDNLTVTQNGALSYKNFTTNPLVEFNNSVFAMRNYIKEYIQEEFEKCFYFDKINAVKMLFLIGDIRQGKGERKIFNDCMDFIAQKDPDLAIQLLPVIPEYTRWDYAIKLILSPNKDVSKNATFFVSQQLKEDMLSPTPSLLAKWLPTIPKTTKKVYNKEAIENKKNKYKIVQAIKYEMGLKDKDYRLIITDLRDKLNIIEKYLSEHRLEEIDMENLTSKQNIKYNDLLNKHIPEKRKAYLDDVINNKANMNVSVLTPSDIVHQYQNRRMVKEYDYALEAMWKMLPDKVNGNNNSVVIRDGSASMTSPVNYKFPNGLSCMDISDALALYITEKQSGVMKDKFITFSKAPKVVDMSKCNTLHDKLSYLKTFNDMTNTDIKKTFNLLLDTLVKNNVPQEEVFKNVIILSDMEFDYCLSNQVESTFDRIKREWNENGYELPTLVFWQLNAERTLAPIIDNEKGIVLLSGYSTNNLDMLLSGEFEKEVKNKETGEIEKVVMTPQEQLEMVLSKERYNKIEQIVKTTIEKEIVTQKETLPPKNFKEAVLEATNLKAAKQKTVTTEKTSVKNDKEDIEEQYERTL